MTPRRSWPWPSCVLLVAIACAVKLAVAASPTPPAPARMAAATAASPSALMAAPAAPTVPTVLVGVAAEAASRATESAAGAAGDEAAVPPDDDRAVDPRLLPPGAMGDGHDRGPSAVVFPPESVPLHFDHARHARAGVACATCHPGATTSHSSAAVLLPRGTTCDGCHGSDHRDGSAVTAGAGADGRCEACHVVLKRPSENGVEKTFGPVLVAPVVAPRANLVFDHAAHASRNIGCPQCHGAVEAIGKATRDQLPRMRGCLTCHGMSDTAARGSAKGECVTCHVPARTGEAGTMATQFAAGELTPPEWLHGAAHTPDFLERHKMVAGNDSAFCANCHREDFCTECHDGRLRPRSIHPNDYLNMHAAEAQLATSRCTSCHQSQSFCLGCHQRLGVATSSPADVRNSVRFHPPKAVWSDLPRRPGHHAIEAARNINACVSCHVERDCVACHGGQGIGGGFDPHPRGFASHCAIQFRKNPRPCLVCHLPGDTNLAACR